ncbi:MAG: HAMP domain-containing histidine kinase [Salinarimonas sp.]|nr:HAMP domain-containing histidine kinase [Salinarimonas sp.]
MRQERVHSPPATSSRFGLSARLLWLTIGFVMLAEVLIYVPSVAQFQRNWLNDRLTAAQIAALVLDAAPADGLSRDLEDDLLRGVGAMTVAVRGGGTRRLLAVSDMPREVGRVIDLREQGVFSGIGAAFTTLLRPSEKPMRVVGAGMETPAGMRTAVPVDFVEIVIDEAPLRAALITFSRNILILSLIISAITAGLVYLALQWVIVRPVRRLTDNLTRFAADPEDRSHIIAPSQRMDEIGVAERALERMERALERALRRKKRLAELGQGVSRINHELRNMLTAAQLLSDRMAGASDPLVQKFAPRLVDTLQRAIDFSEATMAFGKAEEPEPRPERFVLAPLVRELADLPGLEPVDEEAVTQPDDGAVSEQAPVRLRIDIPQDLALVADREQVRRVFTNLARNTVEALRKSAPEDRYLDVEARRVEGEGRAYVLIRFRDAGPGLPPRARQNLFRPFEGSARSGGTGLGLAICDEIMRLHGGTIGLVETQESGERGTCFELAFPQPE